MGEYANCSRGEAEGVPLCVLDCLAHGHRGIEGEILDEWKGNIRMEDKFYDACVRDVSVNVVVMKRTDDIHQN